MKVRYLWIAAVCCILAACKFTGTSNVELIVSPESKITSLSEARDQVRAMRASGEQGDIDVVIADGTYVLDETLIFGLEDSAPVGAVTRYLGSAPFFFNFSCKLIKYVKYVK